MESFQSDSDESEVKSASDDLDADSNTDVEQEEDSESGEEEGEEDENETDTDNESEIKNDSESNDETETSTKVQNGESTSSLPVETKPDEYADYDSSDEEDIRNTVGNIPMNWYDEYKHLGYDWDGNKIIKPETGDQLDNFLKRIEDPDFWRTVKDPQTGQDVVLSSEDIEIIKRIKEGKIPDVSFDDHAVSCCNV